MVQTNGAEIVRRAALESRRPGSASRPILRSGGAAWEGVVMGEWELERAWFEDLHPHDEINHVLEGELVVNCAGATHRLGPGDTIRVPGGRSARYEAPAYARMLFVYGPNPDGAPSEVLGSGRVAGESPRRIDE